jgi:hypothetical protein
MERSAQTAADQMAALMVEVQQKIRAENTYYDRMFDEAGDALARSLQIRIELGLEVNADEVVRQQGAKEVTGDQLVTFMQAAVTSFQATEDALRDALSGIQQQLDSGRQEIRIDTAKLNELQNKLNVLGQARTKKQLSGFVLGFVTQTASDLERLRESTVGSAAGAVGTNPTEVDEGGP